MKDPETKPKISDTAGTAETQLERRARLLRDRTFWELAFGDRLRQAGIAFEEQVPISGYFPDFLLTEIGLIVELDGAQHRTPAGREYDKKRDARLRARGYKILRVPNKSAAKIDLRQFVSRTSPIQRPRKVKKQKKLKTEPDFRGMKKCHFCARMFILEHGHFPKHKAIAVKERDLQRLYPYCQGSMQPPIVWEDRVRRVSGWRAVEAEQQQTAEEANVAPIEPVINSRGQEKILTEGQACRQCGSAVVKKSHKTVPPKRKKKGDQSYWFLWWFKCSNRACRATYMVNEAKRLFSDELKATETDENS